MSSSTTSPGRATPSFKAPLPSLLLGDSLQLAAIGNQAFNLCGMATATSVLHIDKPGNAGFKDTVFCFKTIHQ
jgi:hypothetical protein